MHRGERKENEKCRRKNVDKESASKHIALLSTTMTQALVPKKEQMTRRGVERDEAGKRFTSRVSKETQVAFARV